MNTRRLVLFVLIFIFGCNSQEADQLINGISTAIEDSNGSDDPVSYVDVESPIGTSGTWKTTWSQGVGGAIDEHSKELSMDVILPESDLVKLNCTGFNDATEKDKKRFWALFLSSISLYETDFDPNTRYWESGLNVWSEGLFQLSVSTGRYHSGCNHLTSENILNPISNIKCAVAVLRNQIRKTGTLFPSSAYYWSVLTSSKKYKVQNFFKSQMGELTFCQI